LSNSRNLVFNNLYIRLIGYDGKIKRVMPISHEVTGSIFETINIRAVTDAGDDYEFDSVELADNRGNSIEIPLIDGILSVGPDDRIYINIDIDFNLMENKV
jgi:hypothetical protein